MKKLVLALLMVATTCNAAGYAGLYRRVAPSVVSIHVEKGRGTGMLIDSLHVITCAHIADGARRIQVFAYPYGTDRYATVIGVDKAHDLALLVLDSPFIGTGTVRFRDSDTVDVGEPVLIVGNALGTFDWSASAGIVSGLHRLVFNWAQTDATINPGNSGSPVFDARGRVIGMAEARIGPGDGVPGIAFYTPSDEITRFLSRYTVGA